MLISLKGHLWMLVPVVIVVGIAVVLGMQVSEETYADNLNNIIGLLVFAGVAFSVISMMCFAQFLGQTTGISRLVYVALSGSGEDERAALRFTRSRRYSLLWQNLLRGLIFLGTYLVFGLVVLVLILIGASLAGGLSEGGNAGLFVVLGAFNVLLFFAFLVFVAWLGLRLMLADQSLVIEPDSSAVVSINRSFEATKGRAWISLQVAIFTFLITTLISMALSIATQIAVTIFVQVAPAVESLSVDSLLGLLTIIPYVLAVLVFVVGSFAGAVIVLPLWHAMLTTLYFRLRS